MTKIAIIGAGPCGLSMLRSFEQAEKKGEKIPEIVCFDKQDDWGGLWNYSWRTGSDQYGDPVPNSMYRYLWSNGPKECLEFADYSFDEHFGKPIPSFPPREVLYDYILGRVKKGNLKDKIKFNTTVTNVTYNNDSFELIYKDKKSDAILKDTFDYVVVSTGHFSVPFIPEYPGMKSFPGRIMHSHDFRDAEEFRDKNVVVLGSSYSAEDVALQCHKYGAKSVTIGYRHNPMGFKWPDGMKEVFHLDRLEGSKAIFKDGHIQETDAVILCTGYLHHYPFLSHQLKIKTGNRLYPPI
jgi:trimethylamine monooxygenase